MLALILPDRHMRSSDIVSGKLCGRYGDEPMNQDIRSLQDWVGEQAQLQDGFGVRCEGVCFGQLQSQFALENNETSEASSTNRCVPSTVSYVTGNPWMRYSSESTSSQSGKRPAGHMSHYFTLGQAHSVMTYRGLIEKKTPSGVKANGH
jgi:hypothetical protein